MTVAACYLSAEGVVFGADSTTTFSVVGPATNLLGPASHSNYAKKVFQVGSQDSTLGVTLWGMADLGDLSYRTPDEDWELLGLHQAYSGAFCLGGNLLLDRTPCAFEIGCNPLLTAPVVQGLPIGQLRLWGVPNLISRLLLGIDPDLVTAILQSGWWTGTPQELYSLIDQHSLAPPTGPGLLSEKMVDNALAARCNQPRLQKCRQAGFGSDPCKPVLVGLLVYPIPAPCRGKTQEGPLLSTDGAKEAPAGQPTLEDTPC